MCDPLRYYRNNTVNSHALIETSIRCGVHHFVFSSSAAVYGHPVDLPISEDAPLVPFFFLRPIETDDRSHAVMRAQRTGLNHVILPYFNVAGADPKLRTGQSTPGANIC